MGKTRPLKLWAMVLLYLCIFGIVYFRNCAINTGAIVIIVPVRLCIKYVYLDTPAGYSNLGTLITVKSVKL